METATEVPSSAGLPVYSAMTQAFAADRAIERIQKTLKGADQLRALAYAPLLPIYGARRVRLRKDCLLRIAAARVKCRIPHCAVIAERRYLYPHS